MAEFKAQILGILVVVGVFGILAASFRALAQDTIDNVSTRVSEAISEH